MKKVMWYQKAAGHWLEALPLGNGHIGAMVFGGQNGRMILSENTCWSGCQESDQLPAHAFENMQMARKMLLQGKITEAEEILEKCTGIKREYGTQLPMGELFFGCFGNLKFVRRELDLTDGVCSEEFSDAGRKIIRKTFISGPDKVLCSRMETKDGILPDIALFLKIEQGEVSALGNRLIGKGKAVETLHSDGKTGEQVAAEAAVRSDGEVSAYGDHLVIRGATYAELLLTAATTMFRKDPEEFSYECLEKANARDFEDLLSRHLQEHSGWMQNCSLKLPENENSSLPTDERILKYHEDPTDYDLVALFFQFGRYLLLNSSRPDSLLPAALQGIWNDNRACRMPWTDDMHLDINTQMNYFPAETTGLSECTAPLHRWMKNILMPNGKKVAKELYGAEGFVAHTVSNAYGWAAPGWDCVWGFFVSGGAWAALQVWEHYRYTRDIAFLKEYAPVLFEAARFLCSLLEEDPKTGELVMVPSYSPENSYRMEGDTKDHNVTIGSSADMSFAAAVMKASIAASKVLGEETELCEKFEKLLPRMATYKVGKFGQLMEWHEDYEEVYPDHRHTSHLLALYPLHEIHPEEQPELKRAIEITLKRRLGENARDIIFANWAGALLILYPATLHDGNRAEQFIHPMIGVLARPNMMITHYDPPIGGIYELDGNTGLTAGIAEMLLQSDEKEITVLPALPECWDRGEFDGMVAVGGHKVHAVWDETSIRVTVMPAFSEEKVLRCRGEKKNLSLQKGISQEFCFAR